MSTTPTNPETARAIRGKPPVRDGRRSCLRGDGSPKKVYGSLSDAEAFLAEQGTESQKRYHGYTCPHGCGVHVGRRERRMIFPTPETPCGTPGCVLTEPHEAKRCGAP